MRTVTYDAVIIGGGFAGLACAQSLSRRGLRVMVMEKKPWPGTKPHTTGIVVKELAESWNLPSRLLKKITGVRLYSPGMDFLDLSSPGYFFLATDTPALLRWHAEQAIQSGATIRYHSEYRASTRRGGFHQFDTNDIRCRFLVGSDGSRSRVARQYALGRNRNFLIGIEADFLSIPGLSESRLHVFLDNDIARGYIAWMVPGVQKIQVGLATRPPALPDLDRFLNKLSRHWRVDRSSVLSVRSGLVPCGGLVHPYYGQDVMLLGDAAGMVSPLTAGGIHPAVHLGSVSGELIAGYLLDGGAEPGRALRPELPRYAVKRGMRFLYDHLPLSNRQWDALLRAPWFRVIAQTIFFHHRGLFSAAAWKDIIRLALSS
jgi:flavin-dependent dehydrogenase